MNKWYLIFLLALSGCANPATVGTTLGTIGSTVNTIGTGVVDLGVGINSLAAQQFLQNYIIGHNLQWELGAVDQTQGPVVSIPTIGGIVSITQPPPYSPPASPPPTSPPVSSPPNTSACPPGQQLCPPAQLP